MPRRRLVYLIVPAIAAGFGPLRAAFPQYCIGATAYVVRDETGAVVDSAQMRRLTLSINGVPQRWRLGAGNDELPHFEHDAIVRYVRVVDGVTRAVDTTTIAKSVLATNPLVFGPLDGLTPCGQIGDLTLAFGGKVMRMLFDVREHNTHFEIESPPFQEGTFHLRSLECQGGASPPRIDNRTVGKCVVAAENWEGTDRDRVRYVLPLRSPAGWITLPAESCRGRPVEVITTRGGLDAVLKSYQDAAGVRTPVDFRTQFVLVLYQRAGGRYSVKSFRVDKRGDLTFIPPPPSETTSDTCTAVFVVLYRSGVRSIAGTPLATAPSR